MYTFRSSKYDFIYVLQGCGTLSLGNWCQMIWDWDMVVVPKHQAPFTLWPCATSQQNNILNSTAVKASETQFRYCPSLFGILIGLLLHGGLVGLSGNQAVKAAYMVVEQQISNYQCLSSFRRWCTYKVYLSFLRKFTVGYEVYFIVLHVDMAHIL